MTYKQIKWLILLIPTITIGIWEFSRHTFFLPYISMELGNWLSPLIVFLVTMIFLLKLFNLLEKMQEELKQEKAYKAALEEREKIARELHDGIAQSLFLLSVKMDRLKKAARLEDNEAYQKIEKTLHHVNQDVRQAITNLRHAPEPHMLPWEQLLNELIQSVKEENDLHVTTYWELHENDLTAKEKIELYACLKEALMNITKHAHASRIWIDARMTETGFICQVKDDGIGFYEETSKAARYGLQIMRDRTEEMGWALTFNRRNGQTIVEIKKENAS